MKVLTSSSILAILSFWYLLTGRGPISGATVQDPLINEFMASNTKTKADPQGQFDDWIELYNPTSSPIDLAGMYLTDDLSRPLKWRFPTGQPALTTIEPKGFLLVWADGDTDDPGLHTSFSLSAEGEVLALVGRDGTIIDRIDFERQLADISFGRWPDGGSSWVFMASPTPGTANKQGSIGQIEAVVLNPHRGFYFGPIDVSLSCATPGAQIWYTLDGSIPHSWQAYARGGGRWLGQVYSGPIRITKTTCIRAVAIKSGWIDSPVVSHTYIFPSDIIRQPPNPPGFPLTSWNGKSPDYAMDPRVVEDPIYKDQILHGLLAIPSVCISIPNDDFFGQERGIYANGLARGDQWERSCSVEWIDPCTGAHLGVNAGIRSHGGVGRADVKHALRLAFRAEYGPTKLEFPIFEDSNVVAFDGLVLRSQWNYSWTGDNTACSGLGTRYADYLREAFARDTCRDMGLVTPYARHIHLYINGLYWGLYLLSERPDEGFASIHMGGEPEDYDVLKASNSFSTSEMEVLSGDLEAWKILFSLADKNLANNQNYQQIQQYLDLDALIDYMLMIYYTGSRDAPVLLCNDRIPRNFYAIRRRNPPGRFIFLPWDVEWSLERPSEDRVKIVGIENPHLLISKLMANADFKVLFADHVYKHFFNNGVLTREACQARYLERMQQIDSPIVCESARWGDADRPSQPYTKADWLFATGYLLDQYFPVRTDIVLKQIKDRGWYTTVNPPVFKIDGTEQYQGYVRTGAVLSMVNPNAAGTIYYCMDGSDVRVPGTGQVSSTAKRYTGPVTLKASSVVTSRIQNGSNWSPLIRARFVVGQLADSLRITEIMYNPARSSKWNGPADPNCEFIELANVGTETVNLSLVAIGGHIKFVFPSIDLGPGQCTVVVKDIAAFEAVYGKQVSVVGQYSGSLDNAGGWIELTGPFGSRILRLRYDHKWQPNTDGGGYSLLIKDPRLDPNLLSEPWAWRPSLAIGGSPGRLDQPVQAVGPGPVVISEIMYHPYGQPDAEYIELVNISPKPVSLYDAASRKAWRLTDGDGLDFSFTAKTSITIQPGTAVLLVKDINVFRSSFSVPSGVAIYQWPRGSLDNAGDNIQLYMPIMANSWQVADQVFYSDGLHPERLSLKKDPWPAAADGSGLVLERVFLNGPGNDPSNWRAAKPSPGTP